MCKLTHEASVVLKSYKVAYCGYTSIPELDGMIPAAINRKPSRNPALVYQRLVLETHPHIVCISDEHRLGQF
jgi:hypothetical protein